MTKIRYIGLKPVKHDNVAGTGLIWNGAGTVHEVADPAAAAKLLSYTTVWDEPSADAGGDDKADIKTPDAGAGKSAAQKAAELDTLRERATALGITVVGTWGVPRLTKAIDEAEAALKTPDAGAGKSDQA